MKELVEADRLVFFYIHGALVLLCALIVLLLLWLRLMGQH